MIAILASYSYLGVLEKGLLEYNTETAAGKVDFSTLLSGSQRLRVGPETTWTWVPEVTSVNTELEPVRLNVKWQ